MDVDEMGYMPYVTSWLQKTFGHDPDAQQLHSDLFQKYVPRVLEYKELNCKEPVPIDDFNAVQSFCNLYTSLHTKEHNLDKETQPQIYNALCEKWFVFAVVWS